MANAITYIKNVGKSVGYASFDVAKTMVPVFHDFAETNGELVTDMYKSMRDLKKKVKDTPNKVMNTKYGKFGKTFKDNLFSDIKSGKFYNKERIEKAASSFGDDEFNFDFGDEDDLNFSDLDNSIDISNDGPSSNEMMDIVGEKTATAVSNAVARSAEYIVESNTQANKAMYNQMNAIYGGIHSGMSTINQNLAKIIEFSNENTITHFENSRTFYTEITKLDQERNQHLREISETLKKMNEPPKIQDKSSKTKYSDIVSFDGVFDIARYKENVMKNIKNSSAGGMFSMIDMMFDPDFAAEFTSSPLSGILKLALTGLIPGNIKKATEKFNKSLSGVAGQALMGLKNKGKEFGILGTIANIFGIDTDLKTSLDTSKYEKGKIPFDGITKKAIVEVIPTYLSKILVALTKRPQDEDRFDYETGKFVKVSKLKDNFDNITKDSANRAAYEIDSVVRSKKKSLSFRSKEEEQQFDEDWEAIKQFLYKNQKTFNTRDKKLTGKDFGLKGGMASDINVRLFQELLDGTSENIRYAHELFREIDDQNRRMRELENSSSYSALFNNSTDMQTASSSSKEAAQRNKGQDPKVKKGNDKAYDKAQEKIKNSASYGGEIDKESEVARIMSDVKKGSAEKKSNKSFSQKINEASGLSAKMAVLAESASELAKKPGKFIVSVLDKADARLYDLIYGPKDDKSGRKSFVGRMFNGLEKIFNKFSKFLSETIIEPAKKVFSKENMHNAIQKIFKSFGIDIDKFAGDIKYKLFNKKDGIFSKFMADFKSGFKSAFGWVKNAFKDVGGWFGVTSKKNAQGQEKAQRNQNRTNEANLLRSLVSKATSNITEAATGLKKVEKTGLAVISEGEMIVPPDLNPFNVAKRKREEGKVKDKLKSGIDSIFQYNEGTTDATSGEPMTEKELNLWEKFAAKNPELLHDFVNKKTKGQSGKNKKKYLEGFAAKSGKALNSVADFIESKKESFSKDDYEKGRNPFGQRILDEAGNLLKSIKNTADTFGMSDEDVETFKEKATNFIGGIKEHGGTMAAGAAIGAGASLITGMVGGPLVGAAVGAATALITKSKTVQNMLFGEVDENGERKGGLISKEFSNNIKKYLPDMGKGAAVGGLTAMLPMVPGGPVAGIIVGSALGFAKNSKSVQDAIFGEGEAGEQNKEKFKKKLQGVLPKMGLGAIAGVLATPLSPLGLAGNILLGSALGFASDTNVFKDFIFGEEGEDGKREGGIFKAITSPATEFFKKTFDEFKTFVKEEMLNPIRNAIQPISKQFEIMAKSISEKLGETFKEKIGEPIERSIKKLVISPLGKFFSKLITTALKPAKWILSAPSKIIGGIGESLRRRQIKRGQADYMSAAQRNAFRRSKGLAGMRGHDDYEQFDSSLENANYEDIDTAKTTLQSILDSRKSAATASHDSYKRIYKEMYSEKNKVKTHIAKAALDMVKHGNYEQAMNFVKQADIDEASKTKVLAKLSAESARMKVSKSVRDNAESAIPGIAENISNLGINITPDMLKDPKEVNKIIGMLDNEQKYKKQNDPVTALNSDEQKRHSEAMNMLQQIRDAILKKEVDSDDFKEKVQEQKNRFDWVSGLSDNTEDEVAAEGENDSVRGKIRGGLSNTRTAISKNVKSIKNRISSTFDKVKSTGKGFVDNIKATDSYKKIFGDGNKDYLKRMTGIVAGLAAKEGIDTTDIDHNTDPKSLVNKVKRKFSKATSTITQYVDGLPIKFTKDKNGDMNPDASSAENKETYKKLDEKQNIQKGILAGVAAIPTSLGSLFSKIFGKDGKEEESLLSKLISKVSGPVKIATAVTASLGLAGWAREKIFPGLKMFWDETLAPYFNDAWNGKKDGLGKFIYFFNPDNPTGLVAGATSFVQNDLPGILKKASTYIASGIDWVARDILPGLVSGIITNLPTILAATGKGIIDGINNLLNNRGTNDGTMADLENMKSDIISKNLFSNISASSKPSWFDDSVEFAKIGPKSGNITGNTISSQVTNTATQAANDFNMVAFGSEESNDVTHSGGNKRRGLSTKDTTSGVTHSGGNKRRGSLSNNVTQKTLDYINNTTDLPKAFDHMNQVYRTAALKEYEKVKDNVIETSYGNMTVTDILNSDKVFAENATTGEVVYGYQMLNYNNTAKLLGMNIKVTDEELEANTEAIAGKGKTVQGELASAGFKSFIQGVAGTSVGIKPSSKFISGTSKVTSKAVSIVPILGKPASRLIEGTGNLANRGLSLSNNAGQKMRNILFGNSAKEATEKLTKTQTDELKETIGNRLLNRLKNKTVTGDNITKTSDAISRVNEILNNLPVDRADDVVSEIAEKAAKTTASEATEKVTKETAETVSKSVIKKATEKIAAFGKDTVNSKLDNFIIKACDAFKSFMSDNRIIKYLKNALSETTGEATEKAAKEAAEKISKNIVKQIPELISEYAAKVGSKGLGKALTKAGGYLLSGGIIMVADAVLSFISGYRNSNSILGIIEQPTILVRISCGIVEALNSVFLLGLVPLDIVMDLVIGLFDLIGWNTFDDLKKQREESQKIVYAYSKEVGADLSIEDYNKKDRWTTKAKNWISKAFKTGWEEDKFQVLSGTLGPVGSVYNTYKGIKTTINQLSGNSKNTNEVAKGTNLFGKGSGIPKETFISQVDPRYRDKQFNIPGDSKVQTLGDTGCAPAAAAMAVNGTYNNQQATMEDASKLALKYKVKDDGVNASYFNDEFARHGIYANYITSSDQSARTQEIYRQLMNNNKVVLMGQDHSNTSKADSPFGPNPHYVVANGISKDGKYIYINDPESNTPNIRYKADKILKSSTLGISASVAKGSRLISNRLRRFNGRGTYGPGTVQYAVWNALRNAGYTEIQVAGAMGNIEHESHFDPSIIEHGRGIGYGLVQWSYGRRTQLESYAASLGRSASDVETQIAFLIAEMTPGGGANGYANYQFMKSSDKYDGKKWGAESFRNATTIEDATKAFCYCFERPADSSSINSRITAAKKYYEAFTGMTIDVNLDYLNYGTQSTVTDDSSSTSSSGGILGRMLSVISELSSKYGKLYGAEDESASGNTVISELSSKYGKLYGVEEDESANGNTVLDAEKAKQQIALVEKMYSVKGTLKYAQDNAKYPGSRNPEDGSGDCSSTVQWAYKKVLGVDPGSWTGAQRTDSDTYTVATSTADESKLQLGDLLLKDGHVEMYAGNNTMIGHGGGKNGTVLGPTVKALDKSGKYNLVRRWIGFKGAGSGLFVGRGSEDHPTNTAYDNALHYIKANEFNSILPLGIDDKLNENKVPVMQYSDNKLSNSNAKPVNNVPAYNGRATQTEKDSKLESNNTNELIKSIVKLLIQIVTNTDQLNNIVKLLGDYVTAVGTASTNDSKQSKESVVLAKQNLINAMQNSNSSNEPNAQLMRLIEATERIAKE